MNFDTDYIAGAITTENQDFDGIRERVVNNSNMLEYQLQKLVFMLDIELDAVKRLLMYGATMEKIQSKGKQLPEVPEGYAPEFNIDDQDITKKLTPEMIRILHATLGVATEAGEMLRNVSEHLFQGKEFDSVNMKEEGGDNLWYLALLFNAMETNFSNEAEKNQIKLMGSTGSVVDGEFRLWQTTEDGRFKDGFSEEDALERDTDKERKVLEQS